MAKFNKGINPMLLLAVYTQKQETCQEFNQDAKVPISEQSMVTTGTKHALQCRGLMQAWCEWKQLPAIQHNGSTGRPIGRPPSTSNETSAAYRW
ncbi:hypothetical protein ACHAW6_007917 [Cyclotella cf. meneghiniana]